MRVNEIFYSLQGEGRRTGEASIFVRLSGCDLTCSFCDTEFESGEDMGVEEIVQAIKEYPARWIVWTGGEPSLQLKEDHVNHFKRLGYSQAIETNGNNKVPLGLDWVVVSPKVAEHVVAKNFPDGVDELRYCRSWNQRGIPQPLVKSRHKYLSPEWGDRRNIAYCVELIKENPDWRLSIQTHKFLCIR